jgi:hypothetical protein
MAVVMPPDDTEVSGVLGAERDLASEPADPER